MKLRYVKVVVLFIFSIILLSHSIAFGRILDQWTDSDAYKPNPILFLHGFAAGQASSWDKVVNGLEKVKGLKEYFYKYTSATSNLDLSTPYLERLAFNDPNGSIDTYAPGKLNPQGNSDGWADKISKRTDVLSPIYRFKNTYLKFNLICHSMSGLAAREYVTNPLYGNGYLNIDKIITIGTPHAGTPLASVKKIENAIVAENKYIWEVPYLGKTRVIAEAYGTNYTIKYVKGEYKVDLEGEATKDMAIGSSFLTTLKDRPFPSNIKKLAIYGEANSFLFQRLNAMFFSLYYPNEPFSCGDGIVPRDSQKGYDIMTYYPSQSYWVWQPDKIERIKADHITELELEDKETVQKIISFLDSTTPEFEITSPNPSGTTEIYESSIHIQGRVYKEYLPADSTLTITVTRQEDSYTLPPQTSFLKPSDLWIPSNHDSPVAEFDEVMNFPGKGTYKISCQIKNPAGLTSDIKNVWVKVIVPIEPIEIVTWSPTGVSLNLRPFIYAKILSKEHNIDVTQTFMALDGNPVIFSYNFNGNLELEIYYLPLLDLSSTIHTVSVVSQDLEGNTVSKTWTFTIYADLSIPPPGVMPPYSPPIGYHWAWRNIGIYQDLGADSLEGYYREYLPPEVWARWTAAEFMAEAVKCRAEAMGNAQIVHDGPNNYQNVHEYTRAYGWVNESTVCSWTVKHFGNPSIEVPNPPYTIDVIPVYTVSGLTYETDWLNNQVIVPVIDTNHMGTFVAKDNENYWGGNGRNFAIPYTPTFDIVTTADVGSLPMEVKMHYDHERVLYAGSLYRWYTWTYRYVNAYVMGWILIKD